MTAEIFKVQLQKMASSARSSTTEAPAKPPRPSVRLYVTESFRTPAWFKTASAAETERALAIAAALMPLLNGEVPPGLRVQQQISDAASKARHDAHQKYEEQLKSHESALQRLTSGMTAHLELLNARLREAEEARDAALEEARRVNQQVTAESAADATVSDPEKAHIGTHFGALAAHAGEWGGDLGRVYEACRL